MQVIVPHASTTSTNGPHYFQTGMHFWRFELFVATAFSLYNVFTSVSHSVCWFTASIVAILERLCSSRSRMHHFHHYSHNLRHFTPVHSSHSTFCPPEVYPSSLGTNETIVSTPQNSNSRASRLLQMQKLQFVYIVVCPRP